MDRKKHKHNLIFEPYILKHMIINFPNCRMPFKQLYEPAIPYALIHDHHYSEIDLEQKLLSELKLSVIAQAEINNIQNFTVAQNICPEWHKYRQVRLTASNLYTFLLLHLTA